jgi:hypothetical protein
MTLFGNCDGGMIKVQTECPSSANLIAVSIDNFVANVPVTGFSLDLSTNHQFLHSLDEFTYVFAFGDRVGELTLSGIAFTHKCPGNNSANPSALYQYYLDNKVSTRLKPAKITILQAPTTLIGFLTGMRMEIPNPSLPMMQWVLRYHVIINPKKGGTS